MVFSSVIFLLYFFPVVFILYFLLHNKVKNAFLLLVSVLFYMWGAPKFIFALLFTTCLDFFLVKTLHNAASDKKRKFFLLLSVSLNFGLLFYFKYCNFFIENTADCFASYSSRHVLICISSTSWGLVVAGLPYWRTCGKLYFELEVIEAKGGVVVGLVGSNLHQLPIAELWGIRTDGNAMYRYKMKKIDLKNHHERCQSSCMHA